MGNTVLVLGLLLVVLFVHVVIISAVEAHWLAQVRMLQGCCGTVGYMPWDTRVTSGYILHIRRVSSIVVRVACVITTMPVSIFRLNKLGVTYPGKPLS